MNAREVTGSLWGDVRALSWLAPALSLMAAAPTGEGRTRVVVGAEARIIAASVEPWVALQVPVAGDPFGVRLIAALSFRP